MAVRILVCLFLGYLIGTFSTGYIVGKVQNIDIRRFGSGNAGTTNALRVLGRKAGIITFAGDFFKAFIPLTVMKYCIWPDADFLRLMMLVMGFGIVLGHNFPFWLNFKGGKGIAATGGVFVAFDPWIFIPGIIIFLGVIFLSKYVSLGSLCLSVLFPIWMILTVKGDAYYGWIIFVTCLFTISAFIRHRANIVRLANGTENPIGRHVDPNVTGAAAEAHDGAYATGAAAEAHDGANATESSAEAHDGTNVTESLDEVRADSEGAEASDK